MKNSKNALGLLIAVILILGLVGCDKVHDNEIVGAWYLAGETSPKLVIYDNGQAEINRLNEIGSWELSKNGKLIIKNSAGDVLEEYSIETGEGYLKLSTDKISVTYYSEPNENVFETISDEKVPGGNVSIADENKETADANISEETYKFDLYDAFGLTIDDAKTYLSKLHVPDFGYESYNDPETDSDDHYSIDIHDMDFNTIADLNSYNRSNIDEIQIFNREGNENYAIAGVYRGMDVNDAVNCLKARGLAFSKVYGLSDEEENISYQIITFLANEECELTLTTFDGGDRTLEELEKSGIFELLDENDVYESYDENDILEKGTVCIIQLKSKVDSDDEKYYELANEIGDRTGGDWLINFIEELGYSLTSFAEDESINVEGYHDYGTYSFENGSIILDLKPGAGDWPYVTRVSILNDCPLKLCGVYHNMEKDEAIKHLEEIGAVCNEVQMDGDFMTYDVDGYMSVSLYFEDSRVSMVDCVDDYPGEHEKIQIED